ncbi:hypothetical protein HZ326_6977 [Fusarium oxysporum f. sp. albedinis]|nr:hypothetical protein HZ326_6977 [Fusarium oxysporum f. sp. albedinis]
MYNLGIIKSGTGPELVGTLDFNLSSLSCLIGCFPHNNGPRSGYFASIRLPSLTLNKDVPFPEINPGPVSVHPTTAPRDE